MRITKPLTRMLLPLALAALLLPAVASAADAEAGKQTYNTVCFTCHGMTGKGDGPAGAALDPKPRDLSVGSFKFDANGNGTAGDDEDLALVIKNGAAKYGGSAVMAPWGYLSDADIANVVAYIRSLKK